MWVDVVNYSHILNKLCSCLLWYNAEQITLPYTVILYIVAIENHHLVWSLCSQWSPAVSHNAKYETYCLTISLAAVNQLTNQAQRL